MCCIWSKKFDRSSKAGCRTAINMVLNECLKVMVSWTDILAILFIIGTKPFRSSRLRTASRGRAGIGKTSVYEYIVKCRFPAKWLHQSLNVNGRIGHGIGVTLELTHCPWDLPFHSHLLSVKACVVDHALPKLVVYLACLYQSRLRRQRSVASVYGLVSDGFAFIFMTVSLLLHEGVLKLSERFDVSESQGDLCVMLGCLKYVLEKAAGMGLSSDLTLEGNVGRQGEAADADDPFLLLDND